MPKVDIIVKVVTRIYHKCSTFLHLRMAEILGVSYIFEKPFEEKVYVLKFLYSLTSMLRDLIIRHLDYMMCLFPVDQIFLALVYLQVTTF